MLRSLFSKKWVLILIFLIGEVLSIGMGMGVPIFTILYGFLVGWFLTRLFPSSDELTIQYLRSILKYAFFTSGASLLILGGIWLPAVKWLFDPALDLEEFGMPLILFSPRASFIGWIILMVLISPFLQFLMTIFGAISRLVFLSKLSQNPENPTF